jgi:hypothetical protein
VRFPPSSADTLSGIQTLLSTGVNMTEIIRLDKNILEAKPFWEARPFINPDKALIQEESPLKRGIKDVFHFQEASTSKQASLAPEFTASIQEQKHKI